MTRTHCPRCGGTLIDRGFGEMTCMRMDWRGDAEIPEPMDYVRGNHEPKAPQTYSAARRAPKELAQ